MPSSGLPIPSCSAKISAFLRILLIFPAVPNSPPKNAAEKTAKNSSFHITIIIFKVTVLRHAIMAAPRAPRGRFRWTEDYEKELRFAFSFVDTMKKLPTLSQIDENIVNCPTLSVRFQAGHVSRSAIKNKLDRMFNIWKQCKKNWVIKKTYYSNIKYWKRVRLLLQSLGMPPRRGAKKERVPVPAQPPAAPKERPADGHEGPYPNYGLYPVKFGRTYQGYWPCTRLEDETTREGNFTGQLKVLCDSENLIWWVSSG